MQRTERERRKFWAVGFLAFYTHTSLATINATKASINQAKCGSWEKLEKWWEMHTLSLMPDNETQRSGLPFNEKSLTLFNQSVSSWVMIGTPVRKGGRTSLSPAPKNRPDYYHPVKTSSVSSHGFQRSVPTNMMVLKVSSFGSSEI